MDAFGSRGDKRGSRTKHRAKQRHKAAATAAATSAPSAAQAAMATALSAGPPERVTSSARCLMPDAVQCVGHCAKQRQNAPAMAATMQAVAPEATAIALATAYKQG